MNSTITRFLFFTILGLTVPCITAQTGCDVDAMLKKNMNALEDYKFIKQFPVETTKQQEKAGFSYLLNGNTRYRLVIVDNGQKGERMMVTVRDRDKKQIASNKDKQKRDFKTVVDFECPATGIYYFEAAFENERRDCGLTILGYQK